MEDIDNWRVKFESCKYSTKLLNKLILLNEKVNDPVDIDEITKAIVKPVELDDIIWYK